MKVQTDVVIKATAALEKEIENELQEEEKDISIEALKKGDGEPKEGSDERDGTA